MGRPRAPSDDVLARHLKEVPPFRALIRAMESQLIQQAGPLPAPVLDIGCGDGHFACTGLHFMPDLGVDPAFARIREASARGCHRALITGRAEKLPIADHSFGSVVANCVLEHVLPLEQALAEIHRVLSPEGRFLFGVPSDSFADMLGGSRLLQFLHAPRLAQAYGNWFNRRSLHFHVDPPHAWLHRLQRHGFRCRHWQYYGSAASLAIFDGLHYLSIPQLVSHRFTGRWVWGRPPALQRLYERWLRPLAEEPPPAQGGYIFFDCIRP